MAKMKQATQAQAALFQGWLSSKSSDKSKVPMPDTKSIHAPPNSTFKSFSSTISRSAPVDPDTPMPDANPVDPAPIRTISPVSSNIAASVKTAAVCDEARQRAINIIGKLQQWQAGLHFYEEKIVSLFTLINELDYLDIVIKFGACSQPDDDCGQTQDGDSLEETYRHPTLPLILQPLGVKVRVHDQIDTVIGISRKSSRPAALYFETQTAKYRERAMKYANFYMSRCHHLGGHVNCCDPCKEIVVIFGSSNTDFENSNANGIKDLRNLLIQATEGQKVVLACSQADGLSTNMIGFAGFLEPFLSKGIQLELMVWWSNREFYLYDLQKLVRQFRAIADGHKIDSHYEKLLGKMARIAGNKEGMASASRANKAEGLGFRNVLEIDPDDDSPEREIITISMTTEAKQERHLQGLKNASRAVSEVALSRTENGKLRSPIDDGTFETVDQVVEHIVAIIMLAPKAYLFCVLKFAQDTTAGRLRGQVRQHIKRHIFEVIPCKHDCPYKAKNEADMASHLQHAHRPEEEKAEKPRTYQCDQCDHEPFTSQYHLNRHIDNAHLSMPVTCSFCQSELKNQYGLEDHVRRVCPALPKNETQCQLCNKKVWAKKLADHIRIHVRSEQVAEFGAIMNAGQ
jgi:hypothetical protein